MNTLRNTQASVDPDGPLQLQISSLDYDTYVGVLGIGRINRGTLRTNVPVSVVAPDHSSRRARVLELYGFHGLERQRVESAVAGDIVVFSGIEKLRISDTLGDFRDRFRQARADLSPEKLLQWGLPPGSIQAKQAIPVDPHNGLVGQVPAGPFGRYEDRFVPQKDRRSRVPDHTLKNRDAEMESGIEDPRADRSPANREFLRGYMNPSRQGGKRQTHQDNYKDVRESNRREAMMHSWRTITSI